jgi:hypothetical protein
MDKIDKKGGDESKSEGKRSKRGRLEDEGG